MNQTVAVGLLARQGHRVTVVGTGAEALAALARASFDLVLMDVQMPEMDGLETVAASAPTGGSTRGARQPVVAMTAYTMKGDRERFLESGFDGYVRKPIRVEELLEAIDARSRRGRGRARGPRGGAARSSQSSPPRAPRPRGAPLKLDASAFDRAAAVERLAGDEGLLRELVDVFLEEHAKWLADVRAAVAARDAGKLQRAAHTLKGAVDSCGGRGGAPRRRRARAAGRRGRRSDGAEEAARRGWSARSRALVPAARAFAVASLRRYPRRRPEALHQGDLVARALVHDLVHEGADEQSPRPLTRSSCEGSVGSGSAAGSKPGPSSAMT